MPFTISRFSNRLPDATRAASLDRAIRSAATDAVAWLGPGVDLTPALTAGIEAALARPDVAAVAFDAAALTPLGVRVEPAGSRPSGEPVDAIFAPAGAAVYHRARVMQAGGIDTALVGGHEDADLGWRLALRGFRTLAIRDGMDRGGRSPEMEANPVASARRLRHQAANELATLFACAGDAWLDRALPAALARQLCLAAADAGLDASAFDFGRAIPPLMRLPAAAIGRLLAMDDFIRHLPRLRARRGVVQATRQRRDEDLLSLFSPDIVDEAWLDAAGDGALALCRMLGFGGLRRTVPEHAAGASRSSLAHPGAEHRIPHTASSTPASAPAVAGTPRVSVIVLTALGPTHLPDCLDSLAALDYPRDAVEVIVVDNASAEDPSAVVARRYPGARVVRNASNLGFCGGNNSGVRAASHEWLLFLNDDTRVSPGLLRALFAVAERRGAACVGGFTVSWDGRRVDYAGGGVNFEGRGFQHGVGSSDLDRWRKERSVAFANGAAMLIAREAYRQAGGFPDSYFAYYEDVALGWALWLLGHEVWFCPDAIVYHHHHGTSARTANAARQRLCERNALFTVLAQSSQIELGRRLAASLLLCAERAALAAGAGGQRADGLALVDDHRLGIAERFNPLLLVGHLRAELLRHGARRERGVVGSLREVGAKGLLASLRSISHVVRWGGPPPADQRVEGRETYEVAADWAAALAASAEWCRRSGDMEERRRELQAGRRRDDVDLARRFVENWLDAVPVEPARQAEYDRAHRGVVEVMLASGDRVSG